MQAEEKEQRALCWLGFSLAAWSVAAGALQ